MIIASHSVPLEGGIPLLAFDDSCTRLAAGSMTGSAQRSRIAGEQTMAKTRFSCAQLRSALVKRCNAARESLGAAGQSSTLRYAGNALAIASFLLSPSRITTGSECFVGNLEGKTRISTASLAYW